MRARVDAHMYTTEKFHKMVFTSATFDGIRYLFHSTLVYFFKFLKINLFLAVLGLRCCARAFSSCGLLIAVASLVAEHRL